MNEKELTDRLVDALRKSGSVAPMYRALMAHSYESFSRPSMWFTAVRATRNAQAKVFGDG